MRSKVSYPVTAVQNWQPISAQQRYGESIVEVFRIIEEVCTRLLSMLGLSIKACLHSLRWNIGCDLLTPRFQSLCRCIAVDSLDLYLHYLSRVKP